MENDSLTLTVQPDENILVFEDEHMQLKRKLAADAKFEAWRKRWQWLAWSTKKDETELPAFIDSDTRASNNEVQHVNDRSA